MDPNKITALRPGHPASALADAMGAKWKEPDTNAEGSFHGEGVSARLTRDGRIGEVGFSGKLQLSTPIEGMTLGMAEDAYAALHPTRAQFEENEYGWHFYRSALANGWNLEAAVREGKVWNIKLVDPSAVYPERPYKYADPSLTEAFDLEHGAPVRLNDARPEHGWCFGRPPGIATSDWPMSRVFGIPMRHAFTLRLPDAYRVRGPELVAVSVFVDDQFEKEKALDSAADVKLAPNMVRTADLLGCEYVVAWLTQAQLDAPLAVPPSSKALWATQSPAQYYGGSDLPSIAGAWKEMPAPQALDYGLPIFMTLRKDDPNVGKPAREWDTQNEHSGYITGFSEEGKRLGLERFYGRLAHLGGTMFPVQGYPDFSPHTLEFEERFAGFNFGSGVGQLCLKEMKLDWACG